MSTSLKRPRVPPASARREGAISLLRRDVSLVLVDFGIVLAAYLIAMALRFEGAIPGFWWRRLIWFGPIAASVHVTANLAFGAYGPMWRFASMREARRLVLAQGTAAVANALASQLIGGEVRAMPFSVVAMGTVLALAGFGAIRFSGRMFARRPRTETPPGTRVLLVGAGDGGEQVLRELLRDPSLGMDPVGIVDDDHRKVGRAIHGVKIIGTRDAIEPLVRELGVDEVLLAIPSATDDLVSDVFARCTEAGVSLQVLPSLREIVDGRVGARDIRDLRIEDLLGRGIVSTDVEAVRSILTGRRVLITGAGGSIGSELARQIAPLRPSELVLLDHDETHLHDVAIDLDGSGPLLSERSPTPVTSLLADTRDQDRIREVFTSIRPEVVFHAAAHKHVPVLEAQPDEALRTNVIGTANVADAAVEAGVERFVLISTDKAVKPSSVMGASKWLAERIIWSLQGRGCRFSAVRFGNVVGSRGGVIQTFLHQVAQGGPVTVTDRRMARYFMSLQEAVELVLQAAALSDGGEVFTLDMGRPVNILELAQRVILLSHRRPGRDVEITFVGGRPGEKLVEDLLDPAEEPGPSSHPAIMASRPSSPDPAWLRRTIRELQALDWERDRRGLAERMRSLVQEDALSPPAG